MTNHSQSYVLQQASKRQKPIMTELSFCGDSRCHVPAVERPYLSKPNPSERTDSGGPCPVT